MVHYLKYNSRSLEDSSIHSDSKTYHSESVCIHSEDSTGFSALSFAFLYQMPMHKVSVLNLQEGGLEAAF